VGSVGVSFFIYGRGAAAPFFCFGGGGGGGTKD